VGVRDVESRQSIRLIMLSLSLDQRQRYAHLIKTLVSRRRACSNAKDATSFRKAADAYSLIPDRVGSPTEHLS
jgi:hypothetical protein